MDNIEWDAINEIAYVDEKINVTQYEDIPKGLAEIHPSTPLKTAALFKEHHKDLGIIHCTNAFYVWKKSHYQKVDDQLIRTMVYQFTSQCRQYSDIPMMFNPNSGRVNAIVDALKCTCGVDFDGDDGQRFISSGVAAPQAIAMANGWFDVRQRQFFPIDRDLFATNATPFDYDPEDNECPWWNYTIESQWKKGSEEYELMRSWMWANISGDVSQHKIVIMCGPPRSSKSLIINTLIKIVSSNATCSPSIMDLGNTFGMEQMLNRKCILINDARVSRRVDNERVVEILMKISGQDQVSINRKFLTPIQTVLPGNITIISNALPDLRDSSHALMSRMCIINTHRSFLGREDLRLNEKLAREIRAIFNWAAVAKVRLAATSRDDLTNYHVASRTFKAFADDKCYLDPSKYVMAKVLFGAYAYWRFEQQMPAITRSQMVQEMMGTFPKVTKSFTKHGNLTIYKGIDLLKPVVYNEKVPPDPILPNIE